MTLYRPDSPLECFFIYEDEGYSYSQLDKYIELFKFESNKLKKQIEDNKIEYKKTDGSNFNYYNEININLFNQYESLNKKIRFFYNLFIKYNLTNYL